MGKRAGLWLFVIVLLSIFLRFYRLTEVPRGFHIDEVTMGWNAYSIATTGRDETGRFLPLYSQSFHLDRAIGNFIVTGISIAVFGLTVFAVRFPFAVFGVLTVVVLYFFADELFKNKKRALLTSLLLAISPWHLNITRASSEASVSLFFILLGQWLCIRGLKKNHPKLIFGSVLFQMLSLFFYHSAPVVVVLGTVGIAVWWWFAGDRGHRKILLCTLGATVVFVGLFLFIGKGGVSRFSQVGFHTDPIITNEQEKMFYEEGPLQILRARMFHNKVISYTRGFLRNYGQYFSVNYLFLEPGLPPRYAPPAHGQLYLVDLPIILLGFYALTEYRRRGKFVIIALLLMSPVVAALTIEYSPNMQRAFFMLPYLVVILAFGFLKLGTILKNKAFLLLTLAVCSVNLVYYLHQYYIHFPVHDPLFRNDGTTELVYEVIARSDRYEKVMIANHPEPPYHYFLFFTKFDPHVFQQKYARLTSPTDWWFEDRLFFAGVECPSQKYFDAIDQKTLVVDSGECSDSELPPHAYSQVGEILRNDGSVLFRLLEKTTVAQNQ